jgi:hypothetical protein
MIGAMLLGLVGCSLLSPLRAEEVTSKHGVIGLFSPDRQDDLREVLKSVTEFQLVKLDYDNAEVTLRYELEKLFPNVNPKKPPKEEEISQRLNNLLGNASQGTFRFKPLSAVPKDKLTKLEIKIGILDCKACRYGAYLTVLRVEGVERATVASKPSMITVWIDAKKTDRAAVEAVLKRAGVEVDPKP